jgi:hypothetical protein
MRLLIDNTLLHRIGSVLDSRPTDAVRAADALALFHFLEHLLFADQIIVSSFQAEPIMERTAMVLDSLETCGLIVSSDCDSGSGLSATHESFTELEVATASERASWQVLGELTVLDQNGLEELGKLADETSRPDSGRDDVRLFNDLAANESTEPGQPTLAHPRAGGSATAYAAQTNPALRARLGEIKRAAGTLSPSTSHALGVLFRSHINAEMGRLREAVYSPSPTRAQLARKTDRLFRHRMEALIAETIVASSTSSSAVLRSLMVRESFPLPLLALFYLRKREVGSPHGLLQFARELRDIAEVREVRKWLVKWERAVMSDDLDVRAKTERELELIARDIHQDTTTEAVLRFGVELNPNTFGGVSFGFDLDKVWIALRDMVTCYQRRRVLLAAVARHAILSDVGVQIMEQLARSIEIRTE